MVFGTEHVIPVYIDFRPDNLTGFLSLDIMIPSQLVRVEVEPHDNAMEVFFTDRTACVFPDQLGSYARLMGAHVAGYGA